MNSYNYLKNKEFLTLAWNIVFLYFLEKSKTLHFRCVLNVAMLWSNFYPYFVISFISFSTMLLCFVFLFFRTACIPFTSFLWTFSLFLFCNIYLMSFETFYYTRKKIIVWRNLIIFLSNTISLLGHTSHDLQCLLMASEECL